MGIRVKYGGEAIMQWEGKGGKRNSVGLKLGRKGGVRGREGEEGWNGREELKEGIIIIIIVIIRRRREGVG